MSSARKTGGDDAAKLDLETPRMLAAMKVTGIAPSELEELPPLDGNDANNEAAIRRLDLMDRKRRQLTRQLEETAKHLDESLVDYFLSPSTAEAAQIAADQHDFLMKEKNKIDKKRERVKDEIMKELKAEMDRKQAHEARKKTREDFTKSMNLKHAEHTEEMTKSTHDRAAHVQKIEERGRAVSKAEKDRWKGVKQKFVTDAERVAKQAEDRKQMWADVHEERRKKIADIAQKNVENQRMQEEELLRRWESNMAREMEREERMKRTFEEKLQLKRDQYSDKMAKVSDTQQKDTQQKEDTFNEHMKKLSEARQRGVEQLNEIQERTKTHRDKELEKWSSKRTESQKTYRAKLNKWKAEISDGHLKSIEVREKHFEDNVYKKAELRGYLQELVEQNKNRLARAETCTREQTLAKIQNNNNKIDQHVQQKRQVLAYRANAVREEMIGKTQLMEIKAVMRDCPTKRINQLLSGLDMPLLPTESPKEGEEDTNKQ